MVSDESKTTKHPLSDLAFLREERSIGGDSNWWPRISKWQREGLVRLRWGNTAMECYARLTDAGKEIVKDVE